MLARAVRSGVVETYHDGAILVLGRGGEEMFSTGDVERPFLLRSSIKPFQATISLEAGAELNREQTALAAASHGGQPIHVGIVGSILADAGLTPEALHCPPAWPLLRSARHRMVRAGEAPSPLHHNCSGKHAAALAACVARGWPTDSYMRPDHPYQRQVSGLIEEVTGEQMGATAVDGCGFPTPLGSVGGLARAFGRLGDQRYQRVIDAMRAAPALMSDGDRVDGVVSTWLPAVAKIGAEACAGIVLHGEVGIGGKCWDGNRVALWVGLIEVLDRLGALEPVAREALQSHARPTVYGGGDPVGAFEPALS